MASLQPHEAKSVLEHVGELRKKILIILVVFILGVTIAHTFHKEIIAFLLQSADGQKLIFLSPLDPLFFIFKIDFIVGLIISFPVIIWGLFSYISPALTKKIKKLIFIFFITSILLIILSLLYAFFITIPFSLKFLFSIVIPGIENQISAQNYISFFITQSLIIMTIFQIPILIIGGVYLGAFKTKMLSKKRRYIYLIITIALSILTPTADIFNLAIVLVPCIAIFEISLLGAIFIERLKKRKISETN